MYPRYLYPKEDELRIPYYFSDLELGIMKSKKKKHKTLKKKRKAKRTTKNAKRTKQ